MLLQSAMAVAVVAIVLPPALCSDLKFVAMICGIESANSTYGAHVLHHKGMTWM